MCLNVVHTESGPSLQSPYSMMGWAVSKTHIRWGLCYYMHSIMCLHVGTTESGALIPSPISYDGMGSREYLCSVGYLYFELSWHRVGGRKTSG